MKYALAQYGVAVVFFFAIDLIWLGVVAQRLYQHFIGDLLADTPNWWAAIAFYLLFIAGLVYFVIHPAATEGTLQDAVVRGALFGLVTYATWDLTNLAVLKGFPLGIVPIDMAWGMVLAASVSASTWYVSTRFLDSLR